MQPIDSNSKKYSLIVARLKNGSATLSQVMQYFVLTSSQYNELQQAAKQGQMIADFYLSTTPSHPYLTNSYRVAGCR